MFLIICLDTLINIILFHHQFYFQFECKNSDRLSSNNVTSDIAEVGSANLDCMSTPWVRFYHLLLLILENNYEYTNGLII